jgi:orotate phosphoribosyltransferase
MNNEVLDILRETGAILTDGHFIGTSGKHLDAYIQKDILYPHTEKVSRVGELFAEKVKDLDVDVVVGPALGGIILSQWTAFHLTKLKGREILSVYTEKGTEDNMVFTRGYDLLVQGKKVLVVEDTTNTGGSAKKVVDAVRAIGGEVIAVSVMANRNPKEVNEEYFGAPFLPLAELSLNAYAEGECPMCEQGVPININAGHGKKYLAAKGLA